MPFLCMELLRGEELSRRLKRLGRIPPEELAVHLHQTALALDRMHQIGIVHRDLKPENLFIAEGKDGPARIKVLDFGIAKVVADGVNSGPATLSVGTPLYMSPEQFMAKGKLTGSSDVYALGMIAYTCLTGGPYWEQEAMVGNIFAFGAIVRQGPIELASVRANKRKVTLPAGFDEWFARVTSASPERRHWPATAATRALGEVLGSATTATPRAASSPFLAPPAEATPAPGIETMIPVSITGFDEITAVPDGPRRDDRPTTPGSPDSLIMDAVTVVPARPPSVDASRPTAVDASRPTAVDAPRASAPSFDTLPVVRPSMPAEEPAKPPRDVQQSRPRPPLPSYDTVTALPALDEPTDDGDDEPSTEVTA
jgi:serine/threonine protein kinase